MKAVKSLEESGLLIKELRDTIKNEARKNSNKKQGGFLLMLLGTLISSL